MVAPAALGVVGAFAFMVTCNFLAQKKVFGGKDNKEISDAHPTYMSPDGKTFAIWGFVYLMEIVLVVAQAIPSERTEEVMGEVCPLTGLDVRARLALAFAANGVWLPVFNNERYWAGLVIMCVYYAFLLSTYYSLSVVTEGVLEAVVFKSGVAMNTSWITVALAVSIFFCGGLAGWQDQHGVAGSPLAGQLVVALVGVIAIDRALSPDLAWAFVGAWALRGIYRMQTVPDKDRFPISALSDSLGNFARYASALVAGVMLCSAAYYTYQKAIAH